MAMVRARDEGGDEVTPRDYYDADPPEDPPEVERERICEECRRHRGPCKMPHRDMCLRLAVAAYECVRPEDER
jgi:hypothetical protein